MKTRKIAVLLCVMTLCITGCSLPTPKGKTETTKQETFADELKYYDEYKDHLQYQYLNQDQQHCYGLLYTTVRDAIDTDATIEDDNGDSEPGVRVVMDVSLEKNEMSDLYEAFMMDNPQFFFLDRVYSLEGHEKDGEAIYDTLLIRFTSGLKKRQKAIQTLDGTVDEILRRCPDTDDEYEIEKFLYDYLIDACTYDNDAANSNSSQYEDAYSAYGALVEGRAVCEGYAKALQLLLREASITATVVMGYSVEDRESHMWNLVRINGAYYYADATWDDNDNFPQYTYLNVTLDALQRTHELSNDRLTNILCDTTEYNYFVRNGTYLDTYERDEIAEAIASRVKAGDTVVQLQFAPGKYENALLFLKNMSLTQRMTNTYLSSRIPLWDYSLTVNTKQSVITLIKNT